MVFSNVNKLCLNKQIYQPIKEAALGNIPTIAFCDTNSPTRYVDIGYLLFEISCRLPQDTGGSSNVKAIFDVAIKVVLQPPKPKKQKKKLNENNTASATYMYNVGCLFRQNPYDGGNKSIDYKSIDYGDYPDKTLPSVGMWNSTNITHPDVFNGILNQTFNKAIAMLSAFNYATQNVTISNNETLHSLVQCIPDLSTKDCRACLNDAVYSVFDLFKDLFKGRRGGLYLNPSCNMRYELYPFYGDTTPTVAAPALNTPSNNSGNTDCEFIY
ncbi:hypothetical protein EZV62_026412 [Acer yangbiense]|uniref:Gnk2-homologous domain-containing protein n=1 Tax=Acer yangbiense TaxID=1000413 RepID=A0A5C7GR20_9ROSI|nr:hypothetical protein EZV62_026412 [Acer yangbiense]